MPTISELRILDTLYRDVAFRPSISDLAGRPLVQRLRQIRLSNIDSLEMPGIANITRFEHSLGTSYLASIVGFAFDLSGQERDILESAALIHDTAITPFGHLVEEALSYMNSDFDHEKKWSLLLSHPGQGSLGGMSTQMFRGRTSGLTEWANENYRGEGPRVLASILDAIKGQGALGPCIAGTLDLDNLDNVVRIAYHMGLRPDPELPVRIARAMKGVNQNQELLFQDGAIGDLQSWVQLRQLVYERLMPSRLDFCGKLMLLFSSVEAIKLGELSGDDWHLTDADLLQRFTVSETESIHQTVNRWLVGDLWDTSDLLWMRGAPPQFSDLTLFADRLAERLDRHCFAYRIKDKRKRKFSVRWTTGGGEILGDDSDLWLLGIGSKEKRPFTMTDNRAISVLAADAFNSEYVVRDVVGAKLF
jgi:HD superfamily phosphohydrolase